MPVRMRNGASSSLSRATSTSWARSRSGDSPLATVSRGEWSVSTIHSCPRSRAASAISRIGEPPSDQVGVGVAVAAQRVPQRHPGRGRGVHRRAALAGEGRHRRVRGGLQVGQVVGHLAGQRLGHHLGGLLPDAGQLAQRAQLGPAGQRVDRDLGQHVRGAAEGAHPVGRLVPPLHQERDPPQVVHRIPTHAPILPNPTDTSRRPPRRSWPSRTSGSTATG